MTNATGKRTLVARVTLAARREIRVGGLYAQFRVINEDCTNFARYLYYRVYLISGHAVNAFTRARTNSNHPKLVGCRKPVNPKRSELLEA